MAGSVKPCKIWSETIEVLHYGNSAWIDRNVQVNLIYVKGVDLSQSLTLFLQTVTLHASDRFTLTLPPVFIWFMNS
jgi:hypothetical protein